MTLPHWNMDCRRVTGLFHGQRETLITGKVTATQMETLFPWTWKVEREGMEKDRQIAA
jgi:hypothetical protein